MRRYSPLPCSHPALLPSPHAIVPPGSPVRNSCACSAKKYRSNSAGPGLPWRPVGDHRRHHSRHRSRQVQERRLSFRYRQCPGVLRRLNPCRPGSLASSHRPRASPGDHLCLVGGMPVRRPRFWRPVSPSISPLASTRCLRGQVLLPCCCWPGGVNLSTASVRIVIPASIIRTLGMFSVTRSEILCRPAQYLRTLRWLADGKLRVAIVSGADTPVSDQCRF
jgi:hypothetical protein